MKKTLFHSYLDGIRQETPGETYQNLLRYFMPELITALLLYSFVTLVDAQFIAHLKSTAAYATMSVTNTLMHFITKVAEGLSVGIMVLCGYYHGQRDKEGFGRAFGASIIVTLLLGGVIACTMYCGAAAIYELLRTPEELIRLGVPVLRLRAVSVFLMFLFLAISGFFRGIKHNAVVMRCYVLGAISFVILDYCFIFGIAGFPGMGLVGSACASVVQYTIMTLAALWFLARSEDARAYRPYVTFSKECVGSLCNMSWPVMCDKAIFAFGRIALVRFIAPMGKLALGTFGVIKDLEMLAFVPAIALAQVTTFVVSNQMGADDMTGVKCTVKKTIFLAILMVVTALFLFGYNAAYLIGLFDKENTFTAFATPAFRILSLLATFDIVQVILSSALRGMAQVRTVMWVRCMAFLCFTIPVGYIATLVAFHSDFVRFMTIYGAFYVGNGLMVLWYAYWFRTNRWQRISL